MSDERPEETTPPEPDEERVQRFHAFMDELAEAAGEELGTLEDERPEWWQETFFQLLYEGLCNLRECIQDPSGTVTWDEPFVELQYPLQWNFDGPEEGRPVFVRVSIDEAEAAQQDDMVRDELIQRLARGAAEVPRLQVLHDLTNRAGFLRRKDGTTSPLLPAGPGPEKDLRAQIEALSPEDRQAELDRLLRPFYIGPVKWWTRPTLDDLRETIVEAGGDPDAAGNLSESDVDELEEGLWSDAREAATMPPITVEVDEDGLHFKVSLAAAFHPFVVDEAEQRAFFPMVVGLVFEGADGDPAAWPEETLEAFWYGIIEGVKENAGAALGETDGEGRWSHGAFETPSQKKTISRAELERRKRHKASGEPAAERVGAPPPERRPMGIGVSFGSTRADARALDFVNNLHQLRLPRRWSSVPRWDDLVAGEVRRLSDDGREDLLQRREDRSGREVVRLTREAELDLRVRSGLGSAGFREREPKTGREYLVRLTQAGSGFLEVGLSWWGQAGPLVDSWVQEQHKAVKEAQRAAQQGVLFEDLAQDQQARLDAMLARVRCWDYGRKVLEMSLGQVGRQAQNPVVVPAEALRLLLDLEQAPDWRNRVEGALEGLRHLESRLRSFGLDRSLYGYGTALASWTYVGRGPGDHGDGDYYLELGGQFIGCLRAFESGRRKLRGKVDAVTFDWSRDVPTDERDALGWTKRSRDAGTEAEHFHVFDAGRVFYNAAEQLTPEQARLVAFLEQEETHRCDTAAKDPGTGRPWTRKARKDAEDANEPRLYDRDFCPLLPEGQYFCGALSHFTRNAESGRTLGGTARSRGKTGGAHHNGLLAEMGYLLEPGGATEARQRTLEDALQDIRAVVVDYLGGTVTARTADGSWLSAEEAQRLPWSDLVYRTRWFLFLPETWREDRKRRWEEQKGYRATEDEAEARAIREARWAGEEPAEGLPSPVGGRVGSSGLQLHLRLHVAMKQRGLSQGAVAQLFGVSQPAVSLWFKGTTPDPETGDVPGKPIPAELRPWVERWIDTGEPPTADELAARRTRRTGRRKG